MIYLLFFASGLTALVYELLWLKALTLVFGTTVYAVSAVLTAFFAGLAIGNHYFGRFSDRCRDPFIFYGILEFLIGIYAILFPLIVGAVSTLYLAADPAVNSVVMRSLLRFVFGVLILLPPTILMGGSLPLVVKYHVRRRGGVGRSLGGLYSVNTAGAVAGAFLAGFFMIGAVGVRSSMLIAASIDLMVAAVVFFFSYLRSVGMVEVKGSISEKRLRGSEGSGSPPRQGIIFMKIVAGVSGFASIAYEVVWTRVLLHYTGTTTYAFSTVLIAFLLGITIGSYISRWMIRHTKDHLRSLLAGVEAAIGVTALICTLVINDLRAIDLYLASVVISPAVGWWQEAVLVSLIKASAVMFLPALLMGIALPLVVGIVEEGMETAGRTVGGIFSINTGGAIIGSFSAGFLLVPLMGSGWTLTLLGELNVLLSAMLIITGRTVRRRRPVIAGTVILMCSLALLSQKDLFREIYSNDRLLFFKEGTSSTVAVVSDEDPLNPSYQRMFVDGSGLSGTDYSGRRYMRLLGHLPVLLSGGSPESALVICLGTGMTLGAVSLYPSIRHLDCVEISPEVVEAARLFSEENHGVVEGGRAKIILQDGRNYLLTTGEMYDLITLEPPPPRSAGVVNLYSREFYLQARDHLSPGGVLCQWIPLHDQSEGDVKSLIRTFLDVFPRVTCWLIERNELALVGSMSEQRLDRRGIDCLFHEPAVAADLESIDIMDPCDLLSLYLMDERGLGEYVGSGDVITDDHPTIEYFLFRRGNETYRYSPFVREPYLPALEDMLTYEGDVRSLLAQDNLVDKESLFDHRMAFGHFINGTILRNRGQEGDARRELLFAADGIVDNGYFRHYLGTSDRQYREALARISEDPDNSAIADRLGYIEYQNHEPESARRRFEHVLRLDPGNIEAMINLGIVLEETGDVPGAVDLFTRAYGRAQGDMAGRIEDRLKVMAAEDSAMGNGDPRELHRVALMLWRSRRYEEAIDWFKRTIRADPDLEPAYYNLAATLEAVGGYRDALENYEKSYALKKSGEAANNIEKLRIFLAIERDGDGEIELMDGKRLAVSWDDPASYNLLGIRYFRNGEYTQALSSFMRAVEEGPDYAEGMVNAGRVYEKLSRPEMAALYYSRAVAIDPSLQQVVGDGPGD